MSKLMCWCTWAWICTCCSTHLHLHPYSAMYPPRLASFLTHTKKCATPPVSWNLVEIGSTDCFLQRFLRDTFDIDFKGMFSYSWCLLVCTYIHIHCITSHLITSHHITFTFILHLTFTCRWQGATRWSSNSPRIGPLWGAPFHRRRGQGHRLSASPQRWGSLLGLGSLKVFF